MFVPKPDCCGIAAPRHWSRQTLTPCGPPGQPWGLASWGPCSQPVLVPRKSPLPAGGTGRTGQGQAARCLLRGRRA